MGGGGAGVAGWGGGGSGSFEGRRWGGAWGLVGPGRFEGRGGGIRADRVWELGGVVGQGERGLDMGTAGAWELWRGGRMKADRAWELAGPGGAQFALSTMYYWCHNESSTV